MKNYSRMKKYTLPGEIRVDFRTIQTLVFTSNSTLIPHKMGVYTHIYIYVFFSLLVNHQRGGHHRLGYAPPFGSAALCVHIPSLASSQLQPTSVNALVADWPARMTAWFGLGERNSTDYTRIHIEGCVLTSSASQRGGKQSSPYELCNIKHYYI